MAERRTEVGGSRISDRAARRLPALVRQRPARGIAGIARRLPDPPPGRIVESPFSRSNHRDTED